MQVRTYRARSLQEALMMVQSELGPDARVVQTKELQTGIWERWTRGRQFEIRTRRPISNALPLRRHGAPPVMNDRLSLGGLAEAAFEFRQFSGPLTQSELDTRLSDEAELPRSESVDSDPGSRSPVDGTASYSELPGSLPTSTWFDLLTELIEAEVPADQARSLVEQLRQRMDDRLRSLADLRQELANGLRAELQTSGPLRVESGTRRIVAMVGPTGVGKTTTIAKLAAHYRLREQRQVGLITVDTFRVAAVEQLRAYADIMDLRMEVVSTPREMRDAVARLADCELVLIDTAGRSPQETLPLQQLKSLLAEANADDVQLVISAVS